MEKKVVRRIEKWEDLDSIEIIYKCIRWKECEMGEDFIDQFESVVADVPFATWMLGKGYIDKNMLNAFMGDIWGSVQTMLGGYNEEYCVFPRGECENESNFKKYHLLAEYIIQVDALRERLFNILKYNCYDYDEQEVKEYIAKYGEVNIEFFQEDFTKTIEDFCTIHDEWVWVCNHSIEDVNKILLEREEG